MQRAIRKWKGNHLAVQIFGQSHYLANNGASFSCPSITLVKKNILIHLPGEIVKRETDGRPFQSDVLLWVALFFLISILIFIIDYRTFRCFICHMGFSFLSINRISKAIPKKSDLYSSLNSLKSYEIKW